MPSVPIAARQLRAVPPIVVKYPPTYTVDPDTANALTELFAFGFHDVGVLGVADDVSNAAREPRVVDPPIVVKFPPT